MQDRIRAFLVHFFLSTIIVSIAIFFVCYLWYPAPLGRAIGVWDVLLLIAVVDIVLGPVLTFVVFDKSKSSLFWDLSFIALLQLSALFYGVWTCFEGRPAWIVFDEKRFELVRALDLDHRGLDEALPRYQKPSSWGVQWVAAIEPAEVSKRNEILWESALIGVELSMRPEFYQELSAAELTISSAMRGLEELKLFNKPGDVAIALRKWPKAQAWLPLKANKHSMTVLLDDHSKPLGVVDLKPWDE
ncbi:type IV pilin accessory protein [Pseudomonas sp. MM211]|uniref:TfpX/TfpZ family type IV pilin accessory protein n=1 Tax=Pseudomonas sp. MM211 TaxID=2866808 RepID=UPI001CEC8D0A|nr:TfpX/TfpZ family type IV pilin accessory protein [Pseudomonas sp. MM211]UCJ16959.1 type IV pilin accessory protein [Pseudomonas sp. MM211]